MRLQIVYGGTTHTLGVVELADIEVLKKSMLESKYGFQDNVDLVTTPANRHRIGMKHCRFRVRRWFNADANTDLLFDLHNLDVLFNLKEFITEETGFVGLKIFNCISYDYKEITGTANDIVGEEIIGEGIYWEAITIEEEISCCPSVSMDTSISPVNISQLYDSQPLGDNSGFRKKVIRCGSIVYIVWDKCTQDGINKICIARSIDSGTTWTTEWVVVYTGTGDVKEPSLAMDDDCNLHIVWVGYLAGTRHIFYKNYNTTTDTLSPVEQVSTTGSTWTSQLHPIIVIGGIDPKIHVMWTNSNYDIMYNHRHSNGVWNGEVIVYNGGLGDTVGHDLTIDSNSRLHASIQIDSQTIKHYYTTVTDPNVVGDWNNETVTAEVLDDVQYPRIAIDSSNYVHVVWEVIDYTIHGGGDHGIAYSNNRGGAFAKQTLDLDNGGPWDHDPQIGIYDSKIWIIFVKNCSIGETGDYGNIYILTNPNNGQAGSWNALKQVTNYSTCNLYGAAYPTIRWSKFNLFNKDRVDCDWVRDPTACQRLYHFDLEKA